MHVMVLGATGFLGSAVVAALQSAGQLRMRSLAHAAAQSEAALPPAFGRCLVQRVVLGFVALFCFLGIFYFMVFRPG